MSDGQSHTQEFTSVQVSSRVVMLVNQLRAVSLQVHGLDRLLMAHRECVRTIETLPLRDEGGEIIHDKDGRQLPYPVNRDELRNILLSQLPRNPSFVIIPDGAALSVVRTIAIAENKSYDAMLVMLERIAQNAALPACDDLPPSFASMLPPPAPTLNLPPAANTGPQTASGSTQDSSRVYCRNCKSREHFYKHCPSTLCGTCHRRFETVAERMAHVTEVHFTQKDRDRERGERGERERDGAADGNGERSASRSRSRDRRLPQSYYQEPQGRENNNNNNNNGNNGRGRVRERSAEMRRGRDYYGRR